jgi:hypothetical protein
MTKLLDRFFSWIVRWFIRRSPRKEIGYKGGLILALAVLSGCATSKGAKIVAPHSTAELYGVMHTLEAQHGLKHKGKLRVTFKEGTIRTPQGWYGWRVPGGAQGGEYAPYSAIIATHNGKVQVGPWQTCNTAHEFYHHLLYVAGHKNLQTHHDIMRAKGFRW